MGFSIERDTDMLAIDGGTPVRVHPFAPWPRFDDDEIAAVTRVLASGKVNYWTGNEGREFENEYAAHCQRRHGIAVANGTVALELALRAFGIGPGDEVITASRTYIASASCAAVCGAVPVVADIDRQSQLVTAATLRAAITSRTRAVVPVHLAGWPCAMDEILELAREYELIVVEDCAQAHGATYRGRPIGSFGHAAAFSFCQDKILTTGGEGGMLVLDEGGAWQRAWAYKDIGRSHDAVFHRAHPPGFRWLTESFGSNYRMTEMQAAIGRLQLRKLPDWVDARRRNAALLLQGLRGLPGLRVAEPAPHEGHAYYKFYVFVDPAALRSDWSRDRIAAAVSAEGIPCTVGSCSEIYLERAFVDRGLGPTRRMAVAQELGETALMFLVHPTLDEADMRDTCRAIKKVLAVAVSANEP